MIFLAAREAAHHRLFTHVPWLKERLLGAVEEYARGIRSTRSRIEELARGIDPSNPAAIQEAMQSGMFEPQTTPEQKAALARLETLLALSRAGWTRSSPRRWATGCPGQRALRETLRRRRASGGPAEQTFATWSGWSCGRGGCATAAELWRLLTEQRGVEGRDALWAHPDLIPTADDLDDPAAFVARADGSDPIAELEKLAQRGAGRRSSPATRGRRTTATSSRDARERGFAAPKPRSRRISRLVGALDVLAVDAVQAEPGGGREPLQVAHRPLRAGVAAHPRPERARRGRARAGGRARGPARSRRPSAGTSRSRSLIRIVPSAGVHDAQRVRIVGTQRTVVGSARPSR